MSTSIPVLLLAFTMDAQADSCGMSVPEVGEGSLACGAGPAKLSESRDAAAASDKVSILPSVDPGALIRCKTVDDGSAPQPYEREGGGIPSTPSYTPCPLCTLRTPHARLKLPFADALLERCGQHAPMRLTKRCSRHGFWPGSRPVTVI